MELHSGQLEAAKQIRELMAAPYEGRRPLIFVTGISGVGKSALLEELKTDIQNAEFTAVREYEINSVDDFRRVKTSAGGLILATTPHEHAELAAGLSRRVPNRPLLTAIVKGMNFDETQRALKDVNLNGEEDLESLMNASLGIPFFCNAVNSLPDMSQDDRLRLSSSNLWRSFLRIENKGLTEVDQYVGFVLSKQTRKKLYSLVNVDFLNEGLYHRLSNILRNREKLPALGCKEESPLFVDPQTREIYDKGIKEGGTTQIQLFAPKLREGDYKRLVDAFIMFDGRGQGPRMRMMGCHPRKMGYLLHGNPTYNYDAEMDRRWLPDHLPVFQRRLSAQIPNLEGASCGPFAFRVRNHHGLQHESAIIAWTAESLLQQRGIPYVAINEQADITYVFHPAEGRIKIIDNGIEFSNQIRKEVYKY